MPSSRMYRPHAIRLAAAAVLLLSGLGCALYKAQKAYDEGRFEDAARAYQAAVAQDPGNTKAKLGYRRSAIDGVERVFVVTTIVVTIAFWLWFAFKAGSPLPNQ